MPFTVSHAAAALPLHRLTQGHLPLSALMIGAMSPDFAYFMSLAALRMQTHDFAGLFTFCLPVGLAVWLLFVRVLQQPTVALLPEPWRSHFSCELQPINLRALAFASLGIVLGAMSHVAWDAFTHAFTPVTEVFPFFRIRLFEVGDVTVRLFWLLQILSSIFGGVVLMAWALRAPFTAAAAASRARRSHNSQISNAARIGAVLATLTTSIAVAVMGYVAHPNLGFEGRLFYLLIGGMKGFMIAWTAVAIIVHRYQRASRRPLAPVWDL